MSAFVRWLELIVYSARAQLKAESRKTYIGVLWWVLDPLMYLAVFYVVFAVLLERRTPDFVAFLLTGLVMYRWFQGTVSNCSQSILAGRGLMQQVRLPKLIFPAINVSINLFKFSIVLLLLFGFLWWRGYYPTAAYAALPLLMAIQLVLVCGVSFIVAAVIPLLPDLKYIIDNVLTMLLFLSGIFYSGRSLPPDKQEYFYLNPIARLLEGYRDILINGQYPDYGFFVYPAIVAAATLLLGIVLIRWLDRRYPIIVRGQ